MTNRATEIYQPGKTAKRNWFNVAFNEPESSANVYIYDYIGAFGFTANSLIEQVDSVKAKSINLYINSMGGEVYEGLAIYNFLNRFNGTVNVFIDGMAASIASIIAMAGDRVTMQSTALMFIHNPWTMMMGDASDLQKEAENLNKMKAALVAAYSSKTGLPTAKLEQMMDEETMLTADEAVAMKFADAVEDLEPVAQNAYNSALYNRVLYAMAKKISTKEQNSMETPEQTEVVAPVEPVAEPSAVVEPVIEPVVEVVNEPVIETPAAEVAPVDPVSVAGEVFARYTARFGDVRACAYIKDGLAFDVAERRFTDELIAENAALKAGKPAVVAHSAAPVAVKQIDSSGQDDVIAKFAAITDPAERTKFYKQNAKALWKASKK